MLKPRAKELKEIKSAIRDFKEIRKWLMSEEKRIREEYADRIAEYNPEEDSHTIAALETQMIHEIDSLWDTYGNDATIYIIYSDDSDCYASGIELISGEVKPKMQHIVYAQYSDGFCEYDTYTGMLVDDHTSYFGDLATDEGIRSRETYHNNVEQLFKHSNPA